MSEQTFRIQFDGFYYHSPRQEGLQVTAMTPQLPASLRTSLNNFMTRVRFSGDKKEERLVWCEPLHGFCKLFISRDALYARDYFYHGITVGEKAFLNSFTVAEDPFVNRMYALLQEKSLADSRAVPQQLPAEVRTRPAVSADSLCTVFKNDPVQLAKLIYLAFRPILSLGQQISSFRFPAVRDESGMQGRSLTAAVLVLSVLPDVFLNKVNMRFSADPENLISAFDCNYCFLCGNVAADFDSEKTVPLTADEDPSGIFTALGAFLAKQGLSAYRRSILPLLSCWATACLQKGRLSTDLLYLLLSGVSQLNLPQKKVSSDVIAQFFSETDSTWYDVCAPVLLKSVRSLPETDSIRRACQANALYDRPCAQLPADGMDPFFLLFAGLCIHVPQEDKEQILSSLYERYGKEENGILLLQKIKAGMNLTLQLPTDPTPENIFAGVRSLERSNPRYVALAAHAAADGFIATKDETWINCLHTLSTDPVSGVQAHSVLLARCEELLRAAEDRKPLAWLCTACASRLQADPVFKDTVVRILQGKRISYEEFAVCLRAAGLSENDLPAQPKAKLPAKSVDNLESLAAVNVSKKEEEAIPVQLGILERLCELLEQDCTWQDLRKYVPIILKTAGFRPTMRLQPKIETLLLRQLTVLAPDILAVQGGQKAYVELLVGLRKDFCLRLYPATGAAAGKFDGKKTRAAAVRKVVAHVLPCLVQAVVLLISIYFLFVVLPVFPPKSVLHAALPGAACGVGTALIVLQTLILRRCSTKDYILPAGIILLVAGLLQLII